MWPAHTTHDPVWCGVGRIAFVPSKGIPFVNTLCHRMGPKSLKKPSMDMSQPRKKIIWSTRSGAKYLGKAKTKHLRLALALHLFEQVFARRTSETWATSIASKHLVVANALGVYLDMVSDKLAAFYEGTMAATSDPPTSTLPKQARDSARQQLQALLSSVFGFL